MPRREGTRSEPGRSRERERKWAAGAVETGVREKRLEAQAAPSGVLPVTGCMMEAMTELRGRARPRMPWKLDVSGSLSTTDAAAGSE